MKFSNPNIALGWTSITALIFVIGGIVLLVMGMIGEYIGRIYISINRAPQYVVRNVVKAEENEYEEVKL